MRQNKSEAKRREANRRDGKEVSTVQPAADTHKEVIFMTIEFFLPMEIPTVTQQEHRMAVGRGGKPYIYDPPELKEARQKFLGHLGLARNRFGPAEPIRGGVRLVTRWLWHRGAEHLDGEYKLTKPDTDNSLKLFKDCMTHVGFWLDDCQVASELTEKFWADTPGIYVRVEEL